MEKKESDYDEHGWKIIVNKTKETTHIYLRSKYGNHQFHKPFYLRLTNKNLKILKKLLKDAGS